MSLPNLCIRNPSGGRVSRRAPPPSNVAVSQGITGLLFTSVALGGMFAFFPFFFLREQPASDSFRCFLGFMSFFQSLLVTAHSPDKHLLSRCRGQGPIAGVCRAFPGRSPTVCSPEVSLLSPFPDHAACVPRCLFMATRLQKSLHGFLFAKARGSAFCLGCL